MVGWLKGLLEGTNPTATYTESDISPYFWTNGERPVSPEYRRLRDAGWADYALRVDGLVGLRNEVELGFKQVKWIEAIEFVASFEEIGAGQGGYNEDQEFYGYRMPI